MFGFDNKGNLPEQSSTRSMPGPVLFMTVFVVRNNKSRRNSEKTLLRMQNDLYSQKGRESHRRSCHIKSSACKIESEIHC